ncbi:hypothetical protein Plim_3251 [Planctopirus limnophila DSM 3776]|uniref:Tetratricopeptide repeat protein n=1 Tax=Planctopirus limnophila (strain ATCC 43296 / DSM 3776 / IFAM 1008 / Mu 290) TaxID=521674 RepID=D5STN6_PLAL2|nr:hypothetical protein [Planctopirus limnophila]ADG69065.1 hypothetical protein Plim_3251 [Planctopirus limnophila DSM 3776]
MTTQLRFCCSLMIGLGLICSLGVPLSAQQSKTSGTSTSKSKTKTKPISPAALKQIDLKADRLKDSITKDAAAVAKEYEEAGFLEKAKNLYEVLLKLDPDQAGLQAKVKELNEQILSSNETEIEFDVSRGWSQPLGAVFKDRPLRIQAVGDYKFSISADVSANGLPTSDNGQELYPGAPAGALIGVVVADKKPGKPFMIGDNKDFSPNQDGILMVKINAPSSQKCSGKLSLRLSGYIRAQ